MLHWGTGNEGTGPGLGLVEVVLRLRRDLSERRAPEKGVGQWARAVWRDAPRYDKIFRCGDAPWRLQTRMAGASSTRTLLVDMLIW